ncbi:MAG: MAE_28990/MAE_18760 family HEPN-like nuclease [Chitinophagales bacterium]
MDDIIQEFEDKVVEIDTYLNFIWLIDDLDNIPNLSHLSDRKVLNQQTQEVECKLKSVLNTNNTYEISDNLPKTLKASTFLLLYNLVEATINATFNEYFAAFNKQGFKFKDCNEGIQKIWLRYKHKLFQDRHTKNDDYILRILKKISNEIIDIEDIKRNNRIKSDFDSYKIKVKDNEISGNLNPKKINDLSIKFGLPKFDKKCQGLAITTAKRNVLAHGEETFAKIGNDFSVEQLIQYKIEIVKYLRAFLNEIKTYIDNQNFLINNS